MTPTELDARVAQLARNQLALQLGNAMLEAIDAGSQARALDEHSADVQHQLDTALARIHELETAQVQSHAGNDANGSGVQSTDA